MAEAEKKTRVPPNSKESEMMVLGCMLTNINALNVSADSLHDLDFYYTEHQIIFSALKGAYRADKPADIHLIGEELKRQNKLDSVGGISYLTTLAQYAGTSAFIEEYVQLVREKSILRQMVSTAQSIERVALEEPGDVLAALDQAQSQFFQISQENQRNGGILLKDLLSGLKAESKLPYLKELQERQQKYQEKGPDDPGITGIPTHFLDLDKMLNGFNNSNLMILAARPAMGKTALAASIAENICFKNHIPVGIFSLEMGATQILHRMISSQSEVESEKILSGALTGSEYQRIVATVNMMQKNVLIVDDQPGLKITDIRARARRMKEAHNVGFIVIDYLQLITGSGGSRGPENRQTEISEISRMLKNLARELNIPILCAAQLSRKVEERQGHRPMLSDLRESGCLSADTLIQDAETGALYTIKELAERKDPVPIKVFALSEDLKIGPHLMTKVFYSGKKKVFELKTKSGRKIKASANHPFYKLEGWTRLDQIKAGDRLAIPRTLNTAPQSSPLDKNELVFLGHRLGDGSILPKQPYHYTSADPENLSTDGNISENCGSTLMKSGISRKRLSTLSNFLQDENLKRLAESDIFWDEVESITELGVEDVYDATVPGVHNFVANDLIVHNSIEQDADVVMLLFRRDYYDKYDKPGMAEVIIAKNRHGGVGDVQLAFRKEIGQFANYSPIHAQADAAKGNKEAFSAFSPED